MTQVPELSTAPPAAAPVTLTGGEVLARVLRASGVLDLFGVPAGKLTPFLGAVSLDGAFRHIGTRHEAPAVWMAGALFQATGRIAVAYGESGPGSHNLVSALGSLRNNNLAALILTPGAPSGVAYPHQGLVMDSDNERLSRPSPPGAASRARPSGSRSSCAGRCARRSPDGRGRRTSRSHRRAPRRGGVRPRRARCAARALPPHRPLACRPGGRRGRRRACSPARGAR